ncbi:MAG: thioredoxin family protein [Limnohabitans sp.]
MKKITTLLLVALSAWVLQAHALTIESYSPERLAQKKQSGELVALHFHAFWCPTCWAQDKVFKTFVNDPDVPGTLLVVNYDTERELRRQLHVRSQSTLIVYKGSEEQKRLVGETDAKVLRHAFTDVK